MELYVLSAFSSLPLFMLFQTKLVCRLDLKPEHEVHVGQKLAFKHTKLALVQ